MGVACQQQRARGGKIFPVREERVAPENLGTINPSCGKFRAGFSSYSLTRVRTRCRKKPWQIRSNLWDTQCKYSMLHALNITSKFCAR